jgi:hypothetical protein
MWYALVAVAVVQKAMVIMVLASEVPAEAHWPGPVTWQYGPVKFILCRLVQAELQVDMAQVAQVATVGLVM